MKRLVATLVFCWVACGRIDAADYREEIPFVPTPVDVIDRMLELLKLKKATCSTIWAAVTVE